MSLPRPVQGLVIHYSYLWRADHMRGQEEGVKDRPCAVILVTAIEDDNEVVTVLPITHSPPVAASLAIEIPTRTKERLGLDDARSWVVLSEANSFVWPGPDLRPRDIGVPATVAYGLLPYRLIEEIRLRFIAAIKAKRATMVERTD